MRARSDDGVVVVGGGPCAAVAARQLVTAGLDVTMLDAGLGAPRGIVVRAAGRTVLRWTQGGFLFTDRHRSSSGGPVTWISSLSQGGLTNFWTGAVPRFAPEDFTDGGRIDERFVWPIGYDDLAAHYDIVEDDLRITSGERAIPNVPSGRAAYRVGLPDDWRQLDSRARRSGPGFEPVPIAKGAPWMIALRPREFASHQSVVQTLLRAPNFTLVRAARVIRLDVRPGGGCAESVTYVDLANGTTTTTVRGRAFVLAAGPLDTTEILLRSVSPSSPHGVGNDHDVLGRYLHDHPREWWPARPQRPMTALAHPAYIARRPYGEGPPLMASSLTIGFGSARGRLASLVNRRTSDLGVQVLGTMVPTGERSLSLDPRGSTDDPSSQLHLVHSFDEAAVDNLHAARERFVRLFAEAGNPMSIGPFHDLVPGSSVHLGGTARMHERPEFGVVDAENRVHGTPNVLVCDASCFTTGPEKNPTLTAMAIASRAAQRLATRLT